MSVTIEELVNCDGQLVYAVDEEENVYIGILYYKPENGEFSVEIQEDSCCTMAIMTPDDLVYLICNKPSGTVITFFDPDLFDLTTTWTVPAGIFSVFVECWGAGGGGNTNITGAFGGGGGGGGAYAASILPVMPGDVYSITITNTICNPNYVATIFGTNLVAAAAGWCAGAIGIGASGGLVADSIGTTVFAGGNGGDGGTNVGDGGGGGGACAGPLGPGNAGAVGTAVGGAGGIGDGGLAGGGGAGAGLPATPADFGGLYGGGGGGGASGGSIEAANGPPGIIRLTY